MMTTARRVQLRQEHRRRLAELLAHRRDIAQRIDANESAWDVMFGPATLLFWAFPCWKAPRGLILSDADPSSLLAQMRQAETVYGGISALIRRGGEAPGTAGEQVDQRRTALQVPDNSADVQVGFHADPDRPVQIGVGPKQWGQGAAVGVSEALGPVGFGEDLLNQQGVDEHQG